MENPFIQPIKRQHSPSSFIKICSIFSYYRQFVDAIEAPSTNRYGAPSSLAITIRVEEYKQSTAVAQCGGKFRIQRFFRHQLHTPNGETVMQTQQLWPFGHLSPAKASSAAKWIAETDFSRYSTDSNVTRELKRYLLIRQVLKRPVTMQSKLVDEAWHRFILDTRNYFAFCEQVFGEYLHHLSDHFPLDPQFPGIYEELFGESLHPVWDDSSGYVSPDAQQRIWDSAFDSNCA